MTKEQVKARRQEFKTRLALLADKMDHDVLAKKLRVPRDLLRNWIYRDLPPEWRVRDHKPMVDRLWRRLKKSKTQ